MISESEILGTDSVLIYMVEVTFLYSSALFGLKYSFGPKIVTQSCVCVCCQRFTPSGRLLGEWAAQPAAAAAR